MLAADLLKMIIICSKTCVVILLYRYVRTILFCTYIFGFSAFELRKTTYLTFAVLKNSKINSNVLSLNGKCKRRLFQQIDVFSLQTIQVLEYCALRYTSLFIYRSLSIIVISDLRCRSVAKRAKWILLSIINLSVDTARTSRFADCWRKQRPRMRRGASRNSAV